MEKQSVGVPYEFITVGAIYGAQEIVTYALWYISVPLSVYVYRLYIADETCRLSVSHKSWRRNRLLLLPKCWKFIKYL